MSESYALARRGLPLPGQTPVQPRASWLPAAVRGQATATALRRETPPLPDWPSPASGEEDAQVAAAPLPEDDESKLAAPPMASTVAVSGPRSVAVYAAAPAGAAAEVGPGPLRAGARPAPTVAQAVPAPGATPRQDLSGQARASAAATTSPTASARLSAAALPAAAALRHDDAAAAPVSPAPTQRRPIQARMWQAAAPGEPSEPGGPGGPAASDSPAARAAPLPAPSTAPNSPAHEAALASAAAYVAPGSATAPTGHPARRNAALDSLLDRPLDRQPARRPAEPLPPTGGATLGLQPAVAAAVPARADLEALLAPPRSAAPRGVLIDRVQVTLVSAPPPATAPAQAAVVAAVAPLPARAPAQRSFRNPWASSQLRRD